MNKILLSGLAGFLALGAIGGYFIFAPQNREPAKVVTTFDECVIAGYEVSGTPEECRTPQGQVFVREADFRRAEFGTAVTFSVGTQARFADGLTVILIGIDDSRCKPGVQCVWAGELSPLFRITGGNAGKSLKEVRLGTSTAKSMTVNDYVFTLQSATEISAAITVTKKTAAPVPPAPPAAGDSVTLAGTIECLPKKGPGPHTAECAIGLKADNGFYYGLKNLFQFDPQYGKYSTTGSRVRVTGRVVSQDSSYDVRGFIEISAIALISSPTPPPAAPPSSGTETQISLREGEREGPLLVQRIFAASVTGLAYREYPVATDEGSPVTLKIGETVSNGCTITLTLIRIQNGIATFRKVTDTSRPCPICLSHGTLIDTPRGRIAVQDVREGMEVWTVDASGERVAAPVVRIGRAEAPANHLMASLLLADGRELVVSPGHPTSDGRLIRSLIPGDMLDGSKVVSVELLKYGGPFTYDILPAGETGFYFANGILLGSTLKIHDQE